MEQKTPEQLLREKDADGRHQGQEVLDAYARGDPYREPEPGEHQEVLDALEAHNSGEDDG